MSDFKILNRKSLDRFFPLSPISCLCDKCAESLENAASTQATCWFNPRIQLDNPEDVPVIGGILKTVLLVGVTSQHPRTRERSIRIFNHISQEISDKKDDNLSDLIQLKVNYPLHFKVHSLSF